MDNINDVMGSIDDIDHITNESDLNVLTALTYSYEKASVILENYEGDDLSSFSIFQEGTVLDEVRKQGKNDPALVRILLFIPRLIKTMITSIGKSVKDASIKESISKAEKAKKDPGLLKRIITSKPVKTIALVGSVSTAIEVSSTIKHMKEQIVDLAKSSKSIDEIKPKREEIFNSFKPYVAPAFNEEGKLIISANCNLSNFGSVFTEYKKNIDRIIRRRFVDIRSSKDLYEVIKVFQQTYLDIISDGFLFEKVIGDPENIHDTVLASDFDVKCTKVIKSIANDNGKYLGDLLTELTESIPYDKMKSMMSKVESSGKMGEINKGQIDNIISGIISVIRDDVRWFCKLANNIKMYVKSVADEYAKQSSNTNPTSDDKDSKPKEESNSSGKETQTKESDGNTKTK